MMSDKQVQALAEQVLRPIFGPSGYRSVDAVPKLNEDGEPSLLVTVHFGRGQGTSDRAAIDARLALWQALQEAGDTRFPHFRYDFEGEEVPSEVEAQG